MRNNLTSVISHLTSKGYKFNVVYDIGAHKGTWTQQHKRLIPNAKFFMFEANPRLKDPKNGSTWFNVALSKDMETKPFFSIGGTGDSFYQEQSAVYMSGPSIELQTARLDDFAVEQSLPTPQLIKLDAQGSELDILEGAPNTLNCADVLITEMPVLPSSISYNKDAPTFNDYMEYMVDRDWIPVGVDSVHCPDNRFTQLDVVFLRKEIKARYYGDTHFQRINT